jgi:hypothetical protein
MRRYAAPRDAAPRGGALGRGLRGLWPDRNPLRRACDRAEAAIVAALLAAFLIGAPLVAFFVGQWAQAACLRIERFQQATRHQVPAVLLANAPAARVGDPAPTLPVLAARWARPDGTTRTGAIPAYPGARAGSMIMVWIDTSGRLTEPPLQRRQVAGQAGLDAVLAAAGLGLALLCGGMVSRRMLDRRRQAAWDADWQATEPRWTSRR